MHLFRLSILYGAALATSHGRQLVLPLEHLYDTTHLAQALGVAHVDSAVENVDHTIVPCPLYTVPAATLWHHKALFKAWVNAFRPEPHTNAIIAAVLKRLRNHGHYHMVHVGGMMQHLSANVSALEEKNLLKMCVHTLRRRQATRAETHPRCWGATRVLFTRPSNRYTCTTVCQRRRSKERDSTTNGCRLQGTQQHCYSIA